MTATATALALAGAVVGSADSAGAAPSTDGTPNAIVDGAVSPLNEFTESTVEGNNNEPSPPGGNNGPSSVDVTIHPQTVDPCVALPGTVTPDDIATALHGAPPPKDAGHWEYELCAESPEAAQNFAAGVDTVDQAKALCRSGTETTDTDPTKVTQCVVVAAFKADVPPPAPPADDNSHDYFRSYFQFAPDLGSSPKQDATHTAIANLPTWFWNKVETRFPKVVTNFALIGDFAFATAWHLNTTFDTDGVTACDVSGLTKVGTEWTPGGDPKAASPTHCGHTYTNIGTYNVHGCTEWLIVAFIPPFFVIAFPITVCDDFPVRVREAQVVTSSGGPRGKVN